MGRDSDPDKARQDRNPAATTPTPVTFPQDRGRSSARPSQPLEQRPGRLGVIPLAAPPSEHLLEFRRASRLRLREARRQRLLPQQVGGPATRPPRRKGNAATASHNAATPAPVRALTRSTGTGGPADRASVASTWASTRSAPGRSALWMTTTSATSSSPAFSHCRSSPVSGCNSSTTHVGQVAHRRVALAGADRLDQHHVEAEGLAAAGSGRRGARRRPRGRRRRPGCG